MAYRGFEDSEFPILCGTCLGANPYVRMTKETHGKECKICSAPFSVFRWIPGRGARLKKTEICQVCAKVKNVCQTCVLDLEFGLPTQVRDSVLGISDAIPSSDANRAYFLQNAANALGPAETLVTTGRSDSTARRLLKGLGRTEPYYRRNEARVCSFWVKGECTRGETCPYRHELPTHAPGMQRQNIKDRYYGSEDPVAAKMLSSLETPSALASTQPSAQKDKRINAHKDKKRVVENSLDAFLSSLDGDMPPPPGAKAPSYPSMNPAQRGSRIDDNDE